MKGVKCFGLVFTLLVVVLAVFWGTSSANAIEVTVQVDPTGTVLPGDGIAQCAWTTNTWIAVSNQYCTINPYTQTTAWDSYDNTNDTFRFYGIRRRNQVTLKKNHYYDFYLVVQAFNDNLAAMEIEPMLQAPISLSAGLRTVRFEQVTQSNGIERMIQYIGGNVETCTVGTNTINCSYGTNAATTETIRKSYSRFYHIIFQYIGEDTEEGYYQVGGSLPLFRIPRAYQGNNNSLIRFYLTDAIEFKPRQDPETQEQEDRNNIENQSQETESSSEESATNMEQGTTNLIGAVSSLSGALAGLRAGTCKLPNISAYGMNIGTLDLCTYSPPTWVQTISNVVVTFITVRLAWSIFRRIMNIAKSISGGS